MVFVRLARKVGGSGGHPARPFIERSVKVLCVELVGFWGAEGGSAGRPRVATRQDWILASARMTRTKALKTVRNLNKMGKFEVEIVDINNYI